MAYGPVFNRFIENGVIGEHDKLNGRFLSQARENILHWLSHGLRGEGGRGEREREEKILVWNMWLDGRYLLTGYAEDKIVCGLSCRSSIEADYAQSHYTTRHNG